MTFYYKKNSMIPKLTADYRVDSSVDQKYQLWWSGETMISTPDSSNLHGSSLMHPPTPDSPMSCLSSHSSPRSSSVGRSCMSGIPSPYQMAQIPHMVPNMPTMDSTVSSAEPDLNIGKLN